MGSLCSQGVALRVTLEQVRRIERLSLEPGSWRIRQLAKRSGYPLQVVRACRRLIRMAEKDRDAAEDRERRYGRILSFERSTFHLDRGRSPGGRETKKRPSVTDQAPTPNSMRLAPFLHLLTHEPNYGGRVLPRHEWRDREGNLVNPASESPERSESADRG